MPRLRHFYEQNHYHFLTRSTYRRARIFDSNRFRPRFIQCLGDLRTELGFKISAYVLMPEHFHLLIGAAPAANPSQIMQKLTVRTARFILRNLRENIAFLWREKMLGRLDCLPPSIIMRTIACGTGVGMT